MFNTVIDTFVWLLLWGMAIYIGLCLFVHTAAADEALTPNEKIVALTILGEARGEAKTGMYAVGCVIQQRADERKLTPAKVCRQSKQFSIWNGVKKESELHYLWKSKSAPYAKKLARYICKGYRLAQNHTGNANHYYSKSLKRKPYWAKNKKATKIIGNHIFYKL